MKLMGIYGLDILDCKCKVKRYRGGKTILIKYHGCKKHILDLETWYECVVCKGKFSKRDLKEHKWSHAI